MERHGGKERRGKRIYSSTHANGVSSPNLAKFLKLTKEHRANEKSRKRLIEEVETRVLHEGDVQGAGLTGGKSHSELLSNAGPGEIARAGSSYDCSCEAEDAGCSVPGLDGSDARRSGESAVLREHDCVMSSRGTSVQHLVDGTDGQTGAQQAHSSMNCEAGAIDTQFSGGPNVEELEQNPSDTLAAIHLLHSQFPKVRKKVDISPIMLKTQVYSIVKDRTDVDRELEVLKRRQQIRLFKLVTSGDDYAMMLWDDYSAQIRLAQAQAAAKSPPEHLVVFDWFLERVLPGYVDVGITHAQLWRLLSGPGRPPVREYHLSLLIQSGLLMRQLADTTAFWFSIPNVGIVIKSLVQVRDTMEMQGSLGRACTYPLVKGRKELVGYLSRRKYREVLQSELSRKNLRYSILGMRFHLRDLLGSGKATTTSTTVGPLIRLPRD